MSPASRNNQSELANTTMIYLDWLVRGLAPITLTVATWAVAMLVFLDKRVTVIESNRYTPAMALEERNRTDANYETLRELMAKIDRELARLSASNGLKQ